MTTTTIKIAVFLNTWGNYNENGADGGFWVNLPCDLDEVMEQLAESTGEEVDEMEVFINDTDIDGINLEIDEYDSIESLNEIAEQLQGLDEYDIEKICAICEAYNNDIQEAIDNIDRYTYYANMTLEDVAYEIVDECYDLPEFAKNYFDYSAFARDLGFDGYTETENGVIYYC